jgi:hypothetical protein
VLTLAWPLVQKFLQELMRETTPAPKIEVGTLFATPLAKFSRNFRKIFVHAHPQNIPRKRASPIGRLGRTVSTAGPKNFCVAFGQAHTSLIGNKKGCLSDGRGQSHRSVSWPKRTFDYGVYSLLNAEPQRYAFGAKRTRFRRAKQARLDPERTFSIVHLSCRAAHVDQRKVSQDDTAARLASCARKFARICSYRGETLASTSAVARSGWPHTNGGSGSYSRLSWTA